MSIITDETKIQITIKQLIAILAILLSGFGTVLYTNNSNYKSMKETLDKLQSEDIPRLRNELEFSKGQITILINATSKEAPHVYITTERLPNSNPKK